MTLKVMASAEEAGGPKILKLKYSILVDENEQKST
jgi:hypothetical protein